MTKVSMTFQGDSWHAVRVQMHEALGYDHPASPATSDLSPGEKRASTLADIFINEPEPPVTKQYVDDNNREKEFAAEAEAAKPEPQTPAKPKKARNLPPPAAPEPAPKVPEPQPPVVAQAPATAIPVAQAAAPERELPSLEALKALVTAAVRAAQKKEGPTTILDLLPAFKARTKLDFVMNSQEQHRQALYDLVTQAGVGVDA